jgi:phosphatidylethanolamine/phosphatidyl-N-methylethanolamine N-methyltransferase
MESEYLIFLKELKTSFLQIGSLVPSSPFLAKAMVLPLKGHVAPVRILEVGPGTGPITKAILREMKDEDELIICEVNSRLMSRLKARLIADPYFQKHMQRISFLEASIQEIYTESLADKVDVIVSSLPFTNFTPSELRATIDVFEKLLKTDGKVTFFEYLGIRKISTILSNRRNRDRLRAVDSVIKQWQEVVVREGQVRTKLSFLNFPPALTVQMYY